MKSGKFLILVLVAVGLCAATVYVYQKQNQPSRQAAGDGLTNGDALVGALAKQAGKIVRVKVAAGESELTFARNDENDWSVESRGGYPANENKINQLVVDLSDVKVAGHYTKNPEKYDKFGLKGDVRINKIRVHKLARWVTDQYDVEGRLTAISDQELEAQAKELYPDYWEKYKSGQ